jgi:hypothetical protein
LGGRWRAEHLGGPEFGEAGLGPIHWSGSISASARGGLVSVVSMEDPVCLCVLRVLRVLCMRVWCLSGWQLVSPAGVSVCLVRGRSVV